jgi:hypothetical protein
MRESTTYQYILDEGRIEHAQQVIIRLGRKRFGAPGKDIEIAVKGVTDLHRLDRMIDRLSEAASWEELLQTR